MGTHVSFYKIWIEYFLNRRSKSSEAKLVPDLKKVSGSV